MFFSGIFSSEVAFIIMYVGFLFYILQAVTFVIQKRDRTSPIYPKTQYQTILLSGESSDADMLRTYTFRGQFPKQQQSNPVKKPENISSVYHRYAVILPHLPLTGRIYQQYFLKSPPLRAPPCFSFSIRLS